MPINETLRRQILDELMNAPHKTKGFNEDEYRTNPDLLDTINALVRQNRISIEKLSTRRRNKGIAIPILIRLLEGPS